MTTKQPIGLRILFFAELWERFGFYTVQALLVLYLTKVFLFSDDKAYGLMSAFSALIYATPVIGGYLADRFLGFRKAIFIGGFLYIIGYLLLGMPNNPHFYLALAFLICGNGFFKSSVSSFLGTFYEDNDIRRDSGFTFFYMGINIGGFLAPIICTYVAVHYGWNYGFATAGFGMIIGMINSAYGFNKFFPDKGRVPAGSILYEKLFSKLNYHHLFWVVLLGCIFFISHILYYQHIINLSLIVFSCFTALYLIIISFSYSRVQRKKLWALIILTIFSIVFWALYMQTFLSITLFIERNVNRHVFGFLIPTAMYQSINPLFIMLLSPLFAQLWLFLGKKKKDISIPSKFNLGILLMGVGFLFLGFSIKYLSTLGLISSTCIVILFFLQTCGELSLSPVGLSAVTKLAPPKLSGMLMGVWFLALAAAYAIAGKIAEFTAIPKHLDKTMDSAHIYSQNFLFFGEFALAAAFILLLLTPFLKKMIRATE